jgi:hypothetical protein
MGFKRGIIIIIIITSRCKPCRARVCRSTASPAQPITGLPFIHHRTMPLGWMSVFITAVPITKLFAWGEGDSGGHVLREKTNRGLSHGVEGLWSEGDSGGHVLREKTNQGLSHGVEGLWSEKITRIPKYLDCRMQWVRVPAGMEGVGAPPGSK